MSSLETTQAVPTSQAPTTQAPVPQNSENKKLLNIPQIVLIVILVLIIVLSIIGGFTKSYKIAFIIGYLLFLMAAGSIITYIAELFAHTENTPMYLPAGLQPILSIFMGLFGGVIAGVIIINKGIKLRKSIKHLELPRLP